jgi:hypothetical protein
MEQPLVVPAKAGTPSVSAIALIAAVRILCLGVAVEALCYPRTPGVMGPGVRRDDEV